MSNDYIPRACARRVGVISDGRYLGLSRCSENWTIHWIMQHIASLVIGLKAWIIIVVMYKKRFGVHEVYPAVVLDLVLGMSCENAVCVSLVSSLPCLLSRVAIAHWRVICQQAVSKPTRVQYRKRHCCPC